MVGISIAALEAAFAQACTFECLVGRHGTSRWLLVGQLDEDGYGEMLVQGMRRANSCSVRTKAPRRVWVTLPTDYGVIFNGVSALMSR